MRQSRSRPRGRNVSHEIVLGGLAWLGGDQRRADIAVTEFGADHLGRLMLFHTPPPPRPAAARAARPRRPSVRGFPADKMRATAAAPGSQSPRPRRCALPPA